MTDVPELWLMANLKRHGANFSLCFGHSYYFCYPFQLTLWNPEVCNSISLVNFVDIWMLSITNCNITLKCHGCVMRKFYSEFFIYIYIYWQHAWFFFFFPKHQLNISFGSINRLKRKEKKKLWEQIFSSWRHDINRKSLTGQPVNEESNNKRTGLK